MFADDFYRCNSVRRTITFIEKAIINSYLIIGYAKVKGKVKMRTVLLSFSLLVTAVLISSCSDDDISVMFNHSVIFPAEDNKQLMGYKFGDLNNDGLQDLVAIEGGYGGNLRWYQSAENQGAWQKHIINIPGHQLFSAGDIDIADVDKDGDMDIVAMEHPGEWSNDYKGGVLPSNVYWLENIEKAKDWVVHSVGTAPDFVKDVEFAFLDKDEFPDLVTLTYGDDHSLSIFKNNKGVSWSKVQNISLPGMHEGLDVGDIDGDGDIDLAFQGYWAENPGNNIADEWKTHVIDEMWHNQGGNWRKNATKIFCKDITKNGRAEVFISHSEQEGYPVVWYESSVEDGLLKWRKHFLVKGDRLLSKGMIGVHTLQVGDINNDGFDDVLLGENSDNPLNDDERNVLIYFNKGDNSNWSQQRISQKGLYNGLLVDIDNDGFLDFGGTSGHEGDLYTVWFNQSASSEADSQ